jgi:hypothetical protein
VVLATVVVQAVVVVGRGALVASGAAGSDEVGGTGTRRLDRPRRAVKSSRAAGQQGRGRGKRGRRRQGRRQRRQRASVQAACRRAGVQVGKRASGQAGRRAGRASRAGTARLRGCGGRRGGEASRVGERLAICSSMMWLIEHPRKTAAPPRRLTADQQQEAIEKQAHGPHGPHGSFEAAPGGLQSRSRLGAYSHAQHTARRTAHSTQHIAYPAHSTHRYGTEPKRVQLRVKQDARCGFALPSKLQRRRELHWART